MDMVGIVNGTRWMGKTQESKILIWKGPEILEMRGAIRGMWKGQIIGKFKRSKNSMVSLFEIKSLT